MEKRSVRCRRFERWHCWCYPKPPANRQTHGRVCEEVVVRDEHSNRQLPFLATVCFSKSCVPVELMVQGEKHSEV